MFKKKPKVINISKLQAILLLEVDFNGLNIITFNSWLILTIERTNVIFYKIISYRKLQSSI